MCVVKTGYETPRRKDYSREQHSLPGPASVDLRRSVEQEYLHPMLIKVMEKPQLL